MPRRLEQTRQATILTCGPPPPGHFLEVVLRHQLHDPGGIYDTVDRAEGRTLDVAIGRPNVRVIEQVEQLAAKHQVLSFPCGDLIRDRKIGIPEARGAQNPNYKITTMAKEGRQQ